MICINCKRNISEENDKTGVCSSCRAKNESSYLFKNENPRRKQ